MTHGVKGSGEQWQPKTLKEWYQILAQFIVKNPHLSKKEIAKHFGKTPQSIYLVTNSDTFKTYFAQLMEDQEGALVGIAERTSAMTEMALDLMLDKLAEPGANELIPVMDLQSIAQEGLKRLGYGVPTNPSGPTVNIGIQVNPGELAAAREKYATLYGDGAKLALPAPPGVDASPRGESPKVVEAEVTG